MRSASQASGPHVRGSVVPSAVLVASVAAIAATDEHRRRDAGQPPQQRARGPVGDSHAGSGHVAQERADRGLAIRDCVLILTEAETSAVEQLLHVVLRHRAAAPTTDGHVEIRHDVQHLGPDGTGDQALTQDPIVGAYPPVGCLITRN